MTSVLDAEDCAAVQRKLANGLQKDAAYMDRREQAVSFIDQTLSTKDYGN